VEAELQAIASPRRRRILTLVRDDELSAGEIAAHFDVTRPAVSQHLNVLKEAGLVSERRNGTKRLYRARPEGLAPLRAFLEEFWDERLEALKHEAEREERPSMETTTETTSVEREIAIAARPETVWEFLVDPEKATRWMGQTASLDPRPGGVHRVEVIPGHTALGEFVELDPPRRLVYTFGWEKGVEGAIPPGSTTIEIELVPTDEGTTLRFSHRLPTAEAAKSHAQGWDHYLERLVIVAAGGDPGPDPWLTQEM
jgi:uncharacterized protein YndB with AHSA1/START domain/DNA-binding transcriptional ArsR family regulator